MSSRKSVKTRIAPSPTGLAHVGTAYITLFNYAFAKKHKGKFILRIEDTDQKRNVKGGEEVIISGLKWLGFSWDEFYRQSERKTIYQKYAQKLLDSGQAYKKDGGIILKLEAKEDIGWQDLVRGEVVFPKEEIKDLVIIKKDGFPTYNFAVVVDDHEMGISHVIRAEDHISNTPRQILTYQALGWEKPEFAHLPLLRNKDKSKLSKRRDPVSLMWYKDEGYLPEALLNFISLLGWSHPEAKEIFSLDEFTKKLTLDRVRKTGPIFDLSKLAWMNGEYLKERPDSTLKKELYEFFEKKYPSEAIGRIVPLIKERIRTLKEFSSLAGFFFEAPKVDKKMLGKAYKAHLEGALEALEKGKALEEVPGLLGFKVGDFFMDLRIALTGKKVTPPINESIKILGRQETSKRLKYILK